MQTTIDSAGRLVIPKEIRREAALVAGTPLDVRCVGGTIVIAPLTLAVRFEAHDGLIVATAPAGTSPMAADAVAGVLDLLRTELRDGAPNG